MRTLALDVGTKTIGVAVSDELGITANGITTIKRTGLENDLNELYILVKEYKPGEIVIGVPYLMDQLSSGMRVFPLFMPRKS